MIERRQAPQEFGADTYVAQATIKSLRAQVIERDVKLPSESDVRMITTNASCILRSSRSVSTHTLARIVTDRDFGGIGWAAGGASTRLATE